MSKHRAKGNKTLKANLTRADWVAGSKKARIPVAGTAAVVAGAALFVPMNNAHGDNETLNDTIFAAAFSKNNDKGMQSTNTPADSTTSSSTTTQGTTTEQANNKDNTVVIPSVVEYFRQACVPLAPAVGVSDRVSVITETAIGQSLEDKKKTHAEGLETLIKDLRSSADSLSKIPAPTDLGDSDLTSSTYEAAVKSTTTSMIELSDSLDEHVSKIRDANSLQGLSEIETNYKSTINKNNPAVTDSLNNLIGTAGATTLATGDAVRKLPECSSIFKASPLPEDSYVVQPAADLHIRIKEAEGILEAGNAKITTLYADTEGKTFSQGKEATVAAWNARADAADKAIAHINGWQHPKELSTADENALIGYDALRDDVVKVFTGIRDSTRDQANKLNATTSSTELNNALTAASDALSSNSVELLKLDIRADRTAPSPTTATTEAIKKKLSDNASADTPPARES